MSPRVRVSTEKVLKEAARIKEKLAQQPRKPRDRKRGGDKWNTRRPISAKKLAKNKLVTAQLCSNLIADQRQINIDHVRNMAAALGFSLVDHSVLVAEVKRHVRLMMRTNKRMLDKPERSCRIEPFPRGVLATPGFIALDDEGRLHTEGKRDRAKSTVSSNDPKRIGEWLGYYDKHHEYLGSVVDKSGNIVSTVTSMTLVHTEMSTVNRWGVERSFLDVHVKLARLNVGGRVCEPLADDAHREAHARYVRMIPYRMRSVGKGHNDDMLKVCAAVIRAQRQAEAAAAPAGGGGGGARRL